MYEIFKIIGQAIWLMLPAYTANPMAVVFGGGTPIDLGKKWIDGKRILEKPRGDPVPRVC